MGYCIRSVTSKDLCFTWLTVEAVPLHMCSFELKHSLISWGWTAKLTGSFQSPKQLLLYYGVRGVTSQKVLAEVEISERR